MKILVVAAFALISPVLLTAQESALPDSPSASQAQSAAAAASQQAPAPQASQSAAPPASTVQSAAPAAASPAPAQPQAPAATPAPDASAPAAADSDKPTSVFRSIVTEINVVFTATDKSGNFIKDLSKDDIRVLDDGKPVANLRSFAAETNLPLRVGLLIDSSNSIRDRFAFEQESAIEFLTEVVRPRYDKAFVVGFFDTAEMEQDYTDDTGALGEGVRRMRPGGGTALYDAIYQACRDKLLNAPASKLGPVRKAIILVTDGDDTMSRIADFNMALEMAQRAEVVIYAISTNILGQSTPGDKVLERLTKETGGKVFFPYKLEDISKDFVQIQDELRSQYAISYHPDSFAADGRFHSIAINVPHSRGVHIRARHGYYAPKS
jgi:VWFA-related protein